MIPRERFGVSNLSPGTYGIFVFGYEAAVHGRGYNPFVDSHINHQVWELGYRIGLKDVTFGGPTIVLRPYRG